MTGEWVGMFYILHAIGSNPFVDFNDIYSEIQEVLPPITKAFHHIHFFPKSDECAVLFVTRHTVISLSSSASSVPDVMFTVFATLVRSVTPL